MEAAQQHWLHALSRRHRAVMLPRREPGRHGCGSLWTGCVMDWACDGLVDWVCSTWGRTSCGLGMRGLGVLDVVRGVVLDTVQVDNGHGGQWL